MQGKKEKEKQGKAKDQPISKPTEALLVKLKEDMAITPFLQEKFQAAIEEGLKEIVHRRPDDPVKFLGEFLLKKSQQIK